MQTLLEDIVPEMFQLAADNKLKAATISMPLEEIETIWDAAVPGGKRLVVTI
jgi:hypothetical protein